MRPPQSALNEVEVRDGGLSGLFVTAADEPRPGVLALAGSEGGRPAYLARSLAAEGFACLALRYVGPPPLRRQLVEVPLEYVETALRWLRQRAEVADHPVGVIGASKGAELALLTAAHFPDAVGAVVAYAPSAVAFGGIAFNRGARTQSSWSLGGAPVPFLPYGTGARLSYGPRGVSAAPWYRAALEDQQAVAAAAIRIERTDAPILLVSGDRDRMWPSSAMAEMIVARLRAAGKGAQITHLRFPDAGHSFMPWAPEIRSARAGRLIDSFRLAGFGGLFDLGGRPRANRAALRDAWPKAVAFLREHLRA